jgi:hypothetical protein
MYFQLVVAEAAHLVMPILLACLVAPVAEAEQMKLHHTQGVPAEMAYPGKEIVLAQE